MNFKKPTMKKLLFSLFLATFCLSLSSQNSQNNAATTATMTSSSRLFGDKDDLTSVILVIPKDSQVEIIDSDSVYFKVYFEDEEGFILKRHAAIDQPSQKTFVVPPPARASTNNQANVNKQQTSRFSYLESKYGSSIAVRLDERKIWRGMTAEMVRDSWGGPEKIDREISGNTVKEEWVYRNTWLYLEDNTLKNWGAVKR